MKTEEKGTARRRRRLAALTAALLLLGAVLGMCVSCPAGPAALALLHAPSPEVRVVTRADRIDFIPAEARTGLIFYPGALVAPEAYAPLMDTLAAGGMLCVLLRVPGNLALLSPGAAQGVREDYPALTHWLIGGHSMGGVAAAAWAAEHSADFEGLVLLASYPDSDLRQSGLRVLSVRGTEDGVLNMGRYEAARELLPADARELVLQGGCHAGFACYGPQRGDGVPALAPEAQIAQTAAAIGELAELTRAIA